MPKSKKNIKVRDLKPNKDAKGGGYGKAVQGTGKANTGANQAANMGANQAANMGANQGASF